MHFLLEISLLWVWCGLIVVVAHSLLFLLGKNNRSTQHKQHNSNESPKMTGVPKTKLQLQLQSSDQHDHDSGVEVVTEDFMITPSNVNEGERAGSVTGTGIGKRRHGIAGTALKVVLTTAAVTGTIWAVKSVATKSTNNNKAELMKAGKTTKASSSKSLKCPEVNAQPSAEPSVSAQPSNHPSDQPSVSAQPSIHPSDQPSVSAEPSLSAQPSAQPSAEQAYLRGFFSLKSGEAVYSNDAQYQLLMNTSGNLELNNCPPGFNTSTGACTAPPQTEWESGTSSAGSFVDFQGDGNLVVYATAAGSNGAPQWASETCQDTSCGLPSGAYAYQLFLPGVCPCDDFLCIVVELSGGGNAFYYAVIIGEPFVALDSSCNSL